MKDSAIVNKRSIFFRGSTAFKHAFNNALVHEDENFNCPFSCNFKGMKLLQKINIGVRFEKPMIQTMASRFLEEPSPGLMSQLLQDNELFNQLERYDAICEGNLINNTRPHYNINSDLKAEELKKIDRILDKYSEIQELKKNALAKNDLNENLPAEMIEEVFTFLRMQRLAKIGINFDLPIDTTQVTLDCSSIGASNIVLDLKKLNSMSDVEMLKEGKTNLENSGVVDNILTEFVYRIINSFGIITCKNL